MWTERLHDERGAALVTALLAVLVIGGIAAVLIAMAQTNLRATGAARDQEHALRTAEAGALDIATQALEDGDTGANLASADRNFSYGNRPVDGAGNPLDVIFGAGSVDGRRITCESSSIGSRTSP